MSKTQSYAKENSLRLKKLIDEMRRELPPVVSDFVLSIEDQYSALTRLGYLYDLRLFFNYLKAERVPFGDIDIPSMTLDDIRRITQEDIERYPN